MSANLNLNLTYNAWADFLLERWRKKIMQLGIGYSQNLIDSLQKEVMLTAGGDVAKIELSFLYYGKFVEMGVGKGVSLGAVSGLATERRLVGRQSGNRRRPKKWYTITLNKEVAKLGFIVAEKYGQKASFTIYESLNDNSHG